MTDSPACCAPRTSLKDIAKLMVDHDCGEIPVVDEADHPIGVVTDRDITCRATARGRDVNEPVGDVMSTPAVTATPDMTLEECCQAMEENQIRRLPVVDESGACCGMLSQADIARSAPEHETAVLVREVSEPNAEPSRVG